MSIVKLVREEIPATDECYVIQEVYGKSPKSELTRGYLHVSGSSYQPSSLQYRDESKSFTFRDVVCIPSQSLSDVWNIRMSEVQTLALKTRGRRSDFALRPQGLQAVPDVYAMRLLSRGCFAKWREDDERASEEVQDQLAPLLRLFAQVFKENQKLYYSEHRVPNATVIFN